MYVYSTKRFKWRKYKYANTVSYHTISWALWIKINLLTDFRIQCVTKQQTTPTLSMHLFANSDFVSICSFMEWWSRTVQRNWCHSRLFVCFCFLAFMLQGHEFFFYFCWFFLSSIFFLCFWFVFLSCCLLCVFGLPLFPAFGFTWIRQPPTCFI